MIGQYFAIQAWLRGLDCIILERCDLETFLGLQRFKSSRIEWLQSDLKPWFPYQSVSYKSSSPSSIESIYLSRLPLPFEILMESKPPDMEKYEMALKVKKARFSKSLKIGRAS